MSQSTIFQSCEDGAIAFWVLTSTLGSKPVLLKDTTRCHQWGSKTGPLDSEFHALPLRHPLPGNGVLTLISHLRATIILRWKAHLKFHPKD